MDEIQLVIFDMDGLLFDTERPSFHALKIAMNKYGFDFPLQTYKLLIGAERKEDEQILRGICGPDFPLNVILAEYDVQFKNIIKNEGIHIKTGVHELLNSLDEKEIKKCIASSSSRKTIAQYLDLTRLTNRFDFYVSGEEVEKGKPNPDVFLEACKRGCTSPHHSLVLEDSLHGLHAAVQANIKCIVVPDLIQPTKEMNEKAFHIVPDLVNVIDLIEVPCKKGKTSNNDKDNPALQKSVETD